MPIALKDALIQYGFIGQLANAIPELKSIFSQAAKEEWVPEKFVQAVRDSKWWKSNSESARNLITLQKTDPATYQRDLNNATTKIQLMANEMGFRMDGKDTHRSLALQALAGYWDDEQIRTMIARSMAMDQRGGVVGGDAGELEQQLLSVAQAYGQSQTQLAMRRNIASIMQGYTTLEEYENLMRARAKAQYVHFADQIDAGMTLRDIADPYISTMANTLEIAETDIDMDDRSIKKALTTRDPTGASAAMPLWQFERSLKDDVRWDRTKQARTEAFETLAKVGRDFGFVGS